MSFPEPLPWNGAPGERQSDCEPWEEDFIEDDYYGDEWEDEEEKSK